MDTGYLLMNISKHLKYSLNKALVQKGITVQQWAVIQQLSQREELTAAELASILDMDKPTISGIIKRLEVKAMLSKSSNPLDQRSYFLRLTEAGKALLKDCQKTSEQVLEEYLSILSSEERILLKNILSKINQETDSREGRQWNG